MREGISAIVNVQPDMIVLGEASDGKEAIQQFRKLLPDICLLDWNLPMVCGEEVLCTLRTQFPESRFIVISALSDDDCVRKALCAGAQAFIHKDMLRRELLRAIRTVYEGRKYLPEKIANRLKKDR